MDKYTFLALVCAGLVITLIVVSMFSLPTLNKAIYKSAEDNQIQVRPTTADIAGNKSISVREGVWQVNEKEICDSYSGAVDRSYINSTTSGDILVCVHDAEIGDYNGEPVFIPSITHRLVQVNGEWVRLKELDDI